MARRLELGTNEPKRKILSVKTQAEKFFDRLDEIIGGDDSISELADLQAEPRADFEFLAENLARIIVDVQKKLDYFAANKELVARVVDLQTNWSDSYKLFKTNLREELSAICRDESIDEEIFSEWYDDWQKKRFEIEQRFLPLIEFGFKGNFSDYVGKVLIILGEYRDAVDKFYLNERKNIYQKFAFVPKGNFQEKFETESEIYKLTSKFQRDLKEIIFSLDAAEERQFLLKWSEPLVNFSIDELSCFVIKRELVAISDETLSQFEDLKRKSFTEYLSDEKSYGEAIQKREREYNALIFRMRKELNKA